MADGEGSGAEEARRERARARSRAWKARNREHLKRASKGEEVLALLGCTVPELMARIEAQWLPGMSWDNHAPDGWHIDHRRPVSSFRMAVPEERAACWHFSNLQPLWSLDNRRKGNRP